MGVGPRKRGTGTDDPTRRIARLLTVARTTRGRGGPGIEELLHALRRHLGMDVAFVAEFRGGRRIFRHVDTDQPESSVQVGAGDSLEETYCQRVVDGRLPELIQDARALPEALTLPATTALPVGAHLSVPITLSDGSRYGTLCCFSSKPDLSLNERDLAMMRVFAELAAKKIEADVKEQEKEVAVLERLSGVFTGDAEGLVTVFQPIVDLGTLAPAGYEALSRFQREPVGTPDVWFADAKSVGLDIALDLAAIGRALRGGAALPAGTYLAINVTPSTITSGRLHEAFAEADPAQTVLEITEHTVIQNYDELADALAPLRKAGFRVSVDDAGAGYASLHHILRLQPEMVKLDMSLTRGIDSDPARCALAAAMVKFSADTGSTLVAEGVETAAELDALVEVGVTHAQGYYLGRPVRLPAALR